MNNEQKTFRRRIGPRFWAVVLALSLAAAAFAAVRLAAGQRAYTAARQEYDGLRAGIMPDAAPAPAGAAPGEGMADALTNLAATNPDFVGWLEIAGTGVSYPVVQGGDNDKYLHTTFSGEENKLGAIFMDARCAGDFGGPHTIVYGHNAKDGSMFGALSALPAPDAGEYPAITITLPNGTALIYRAFAARNSDVDDAAYQTGLAPGEDMAAFAAKIGAPAGTVRILTLSTCADTGGEDKRLLVHAALVQTTGTSEPE